MILYSVYFSYNKFWLDLFQITYQDLGSVFGFSCPTQMASREQKLN